jgi:hypothetical protein
MLENYHLIYAVALLNISRLTVSLGNSRSIPGVDNLSKALFNCKGVIVGGFGIGTRASSKRGDGKNLVTQLGSEACVIAYTDDKDSPVKSLSRTKVVKSEERMGSNILEG